MQDPRVSERTGTAICMVEGCELCECDGCGSLGRPDLTVRFRTDPMATGFCALGALA
jgi:hypothetical protein